MTELNKRLGSMDYDGLIADIYPKLGGQRRHHP